MKRIASLVIRSWRQELSYAEQEELDRWAGESPLNAQLLEQLTNDESLRKELLDYYEAEESKDTIWKKIEDATTETEVTPVVPLVVRTRRKYALAIAAVTVATIFTTGLYLSSRRTGKPVVTAVAKTITPADIVPGGNKAVLVLQSGKQISVTDAALGALAEEGNATVSKTSDGVLRYDALTNGTNAVAGINTLATPRGGQFTLVLPDKSTVYLNAASSITYPTAFTGSDRQVSITGEAYFEVSKDAARPFRVKVSSGGREEIVEVLGTHFNINAYDDESVVKTTLIEGKVKVSTGGSQSAVLKPGQQVSLSQTSQLSQPAAVQTDEVVAWKNNEFFFAGADIQTMLRQAARWYDIQVEYPHGKPNDRFRGRIDRNVNLDQFLKILEISEVKSRLEGRKLIVYK